MKTCKVCKERKGYHCFDKATSTADGLDLRCKSCKAAAYRAKRDANPIATYYVAKRSWCRGRGITFTLSQSYLESIWTGTCPVFGIPVALGGSGKGSHNSAHLDRLNPSLGYIEGNVTWISGRANRIKYDATLDELKQLVTWIERVTTSRKA